MRQKYGRDGVGLYIGNPTAHHHGTTMLVQLFGSALRTHNKFDANSQDANPKLFASLLMYGDLTSITVPDVDRTDHLLILGANPAASNGSLMSLGDARGRLQAIRRRGGRVVLIDPRRTETAAWADEHHFIRPGGDAALLLAMLQVLFAERRVDERALAHTTRGLAHLRGLALAYPPERVTGAVGLEAEAIRRLARDFADARRAVAYGRIGTCQNPFGPVVSWLIEALNVVAGRFDVEGGAMFARPAADLSRLARLLVPNRWNRWRSRVRGLPELAGQLPAAVMAEEMETAGPGQIRAFVTIAGNPVLSTSNGERLARALADLDFMLAIDCYINETTRHAHLILPPTHVLEQGHYDLLFNALSVRNTVKYSEPVVSPPGGALADWEILYEVGMRVGGLRTGNLLADVLLKLAWKAGWRLHPDRVVDALLRTGPYRVSLKKVRAAPHGLDLGPLVPSRKTKVRHLGHRVELAPEPLLADANRLACWLEEQDRLDGQLVLIGRRHLRSNNSWMHNARSLVKGPDRAALLMHGDDALRLGLTDGALVRIASRTGQVNARLQLTTDIRPGVVSLPHGYGHAVVSDTLAVAGKLGGPNLNALTDDQSVEPLLGTAILNGVPVTVASATPD